MICPFCNKECKNDNSLRNHKRLCKENPARQTSNFVKYNKTAVAWNKGLTKETDKRIADASGALSKAMKSVVQREDYLGPCKSEYWTPERRLAKSEEKKKLFAEFPEVHPNRKLAGNRSKMTYPEKVAFDWLTENNISFINQQHISGKYVDFCVGNIIIEIDGERWHPLNNEKDKTRDNEFTKMGYIVYRIRSKENIIERLSEIFSVRC